MKRQPMSIRALLLITISLLTGLIAFMSLREIYTGWQKLHAMQQLNVATRLGDRFFDVADKYSVERGLTYTLLDTGDQAILDKLRPELERDRQSADEGLAGAIGELKKYQIATANSESDKMQAQMDELKALRTKIDEALKLPKEKRDRELLQRSFDSLTGMITQSQNLWMEFIRGFMNIDPLVTLHVRLKRQLGVIADYIGRERAVIGKLLANNADPQPKEQAKLLQWQGKIDISFANGATLAAQSGMGDTINPYIKDAKSHYLNVHDMVQNLFYLPGVKHTGMYPISADQWLEVSNETSDSLNALKNAALEHTGRYVAALEQESQRAIIMHGLLLLLAVTLCAYSFTVITRRVIGPINVMVTALTDTMSGKTTVVQPVSHAQDEIGKLGQVLEAFQHNMDEIRQNAITLENYTRALERSNKELDDFAYIASHDLKEPLRGIHNHSRFLLEDNADKLDKDSVDKLNRLVHLSQRMERLVNDLLYFSRLGRQELAIQKTDMNEVIHDIESTLDHFLQERHGKIVIPTLLPTVTCDKTRVTEVFRNLITNAIKYNDHPEKHVEIGFQAQAATPDGTSYNNVFYIKDDGRGIAPEFHTEIFRIFKRLQAADNSKEEGTGVGLTFVKKIIERHDGRIWLTSEPGNGTTFYFTLEGARHDRSEAA